MSKIGIYGRSGLLRQGVIGIFLAVPFFAGAAAASDPVPHGRELAQRVYERPDGRDVSAQVVMLLAEQNYPARVRHFFNYRMDKGAGEVWSLIRFTNPADIEGVGLLTLDHPETVSDQWLFLPEIERARRVSAARKGGRFVGSDLFYEDLQDRGVDMDRHRLVGREVFQNVKCDVLESVPVDPNNSVYSKRVSWIHPQTLIPLRIDYYQMGREEPVKRLTAHRIEKVQGYWTVMDSTMTDLKSGHRTRLKVERIVYDRNLPDELFARQALEDPARESAFRP